MSKLNLNEETTINIQKSMNHLWNLGHESLSIHPGLAGFYMSNFQRSGIVTETEITTNLKKKFCQGCGTPFIPELTCKASIKSFPKRNDTLLKIKKRTISETNVLLDQELEVQVNLASVTELGDNFNFKTRNYFYNNETTYNLKKQIKSKKQTSRIRGPAVNYNSYKCLVCSALTTIPGGDNKTIYAGFKKIKGIPDNQAPPRQECLRSTSVSNEQSTTPKKTAQNPLSSISAKDDPYKNPTSKAKKSKNKTLLPPQKKAVAKLPSAKLMNLSKLLAKDKKEKEEKEKAKTFSLEDFLTNLN